MIQIVRQAIMASLYTGEFAGIDPIDAKQARVSMQAVHAELTRECEQKVDDGDGSITYKGKTASGDKWCVFVMLESV